MYQNTRKFILFCIFFVLGIPFFYITVKYGYAYLNGPDLYEGDRLVEKVCRNCGGGGRDRQLAEEYPLAGGKCPFCRGKGKVQVILPGPNRPTRYFGAVVNLVNAGDRFTGGMPANLRRMPNPFTGGAEIPGAIPGALLTFSPSSGEDIVVRAGSKGRFSRRLPPGIYTLKVTAAGFQPLEEELEVKPLTEPIWLEKATLIDPESVASGTFGMNMAVYLSMDEDEGGFIRISAGL